MVADSATKMKFILHLLLQLKILCFVLSKNVMGKESSSKNNEYQMADSKDTMKLHDEFKINRHVENNGFHRYNNFD